MSIASADTFLDPSFGNSGKVITSFGHESAPYRTISQNDGKTIVAGYAYDGSKNQFALARYNSDGSLDTSFGTNGKVVQSFANSDTITALQIQSDGKYIVGGNSGDNSGYRWALARYNTDGTLDTSFGGGLVTTAFVGSSHSDSIRDIAIQSDGKIVAVGQIFNQGTYEVAIARYNTDGSLDTTFNSSGNIPGTMHLHLVEPSSQLTAVKIQSDGKIIAWGDKTDGVFWTVFLLRFNADGTPDNSFGSSGNVMVPHFGNNEFSTDMALQSDGKIVATGRYNVDSSGNNDDTFVFRYNTNGTADSTFATNGQFFNSFSPGNEVTNSIRMNTDGSILLGGSYNDGTNFDFGLIKLLANGTIDTNFGNSGTELISMNNGDSTITSVDLDALPRIVATGYASNGNYDDWGLVRSAPLFKIEVAASPNSGTYNVGDTFNINVNVNDAGQAFNAAQADVLVSSNLHVNSINTARTNSCNFNYTNQPTASNPSFAGAIFNGSNTNCTAYTMSVTATGVGPASVNFNNASIKSASTHAEILTNIHDASFTINAAQPSPTPPGTTLLSVDDSVQGTGQNQWNYQGNGWSHCTDSSNPACNPNVYNNSVSWDGTTNDTATISFTGTQIKLYGLVDPGHGIAGVSIDGGPETNVDLYASSRAGNVLLWTSQTLTPETHTLTVRVTGTKNSNSNGAYITIDRADILQTDASGLTDTNTVLETYNSTFTLTGTKNTNITHVFVNGSESGVSFGTSTTWQGVENVSLGNNNFVIYGKDDNNVQSPSINVSVSRHTLGDINGDSTIDLTDASLFAVDWGKTSSLTYPLSDMDGNGSVNLTDLSILAGLEQ